LTLPPPEWTKALRQDDRGARLSIRANLANVRLALRKCPELTGIVAYDRFTQRIMRVAQTPWRQDVGPWEEIDTLRLTEFLQLVDMGVSAEVVYQGVLTEAYDHSVHSVQDYLTSLSWDGTNRVATWLTEYLGVADTAYARAIGRKFLISAVARACQPGCKVDTMLVLEGDQGIGKSTALRIIAGDAWFTDQLPPLSSKDASIQLKGKWIIEISELDAMRRAEITETKAFLSRTVDTYRGLYAKITEDHPRQCVFAGTTNSDDYLRDATGARRFWPARCTKVDKEGLFRDRVQLWAEAVALFQAGEQWHLTAAEEALAGNEQGDRYAEDPWAPFIDRYVWQHQRVTLEDVLRKSEIELKPHQIEQLARKRVIDHLKRWGWINKKSGSQRYYLRPDRIPSEKAEFAGDVQDSFALDALGFKSEFDLKLDNDNQVSQQAA
jgi:predicted P-loop ATPase